jgi:hypothetical protein
MTEPSTTGTTDRALTRRRRANVFRIFFINLLIIAAPVAFYVFYYSESRVEQITVHNMRALTSVAAHIVEVVHNYNRIAQRFVVPFGAEDLDALMSDLGESVPACRTDTMTRAIQTIRRIQDTSSREWQALPSAPTLTLLPVKLDNAAPESPDDVAPCTAQLRRLAEARADESNAGACRSEPRLTVIGSRRFFEIDNCRPFRKDPVAGYFDDSQSRVIADAVGGYGTRVRVAFNELVLHLTKGLSGDFDQILIADQDGVPLYNSLYEERPVEHSYLPGYTLRARSDFAEFASLSAILADSAGGQSTGSAQSSGSTAASGARRDAMAARRILGGNHTRMARVDIAGVRFRLFIQPFAVGRIQTAVDCGEDQDCASAPDARYWNLIGLVRESTLQSRALDLPSAVVVPAITTLAAILAILPFVWLWTSGDRQLLLRRHLVLLLVSGGLAVMLITSEFMYFVHRDAVASALDYARDTVARKIKSDLRVELEDKLDLLENRTRRQLTSTDAACARDADCYCNEVEALELATNGASPTSFPSLDLSLLLDAQGTQSGKSCSYRFAQPERLRLDFRTYFRRAKDGELWYETRQRVPFFLERITSVLDNTIETALSVRVRDLVPDVELPDHASQTDDDDRSGDDPSPAVAVLIGRLASLENVALPPFLGFLVFENESGRVLFHHAPEDDSLAANFIRETNFDPGLLALVGKGRTASVQLRYRAETIDARVTPLATGIPWTLVVYRGQQVEETIGLISLAIGFGALLVIYSTLALIAIPIVLLNRKALRLWPYRFGTHRQLRAASIAMGLCAVGGLAALGILEQLSFPESWLPPLILLAALWVAWRIARSRRVSGQQPASASVNRYSAIFLVLLYLNVGVIPVILITNHYHTRVDRALGPVVLKEARQSIEARCADFDRFLRRYTDDLQRAPSLLAPVFGRYIEVPADGSFERVGASCRRYPNLQLGDRTDEEAALESQVDRTPPDRALIDLFASISDQSPLAAALIRNVKSEFLNRAKGVAQIRKIAPVTKSAGAAAEAISDGIALAGMTAVILAVLLAFIPLTLSRRLLTARVDAPLEPKTGPVRSRTLSLTNDGATVVLINDERMESELLTAGAHTFTLPARASSSEVDTAAEAERVALAHIDRVLFDAEARRTALPALERIVASHKSIVLTSALNPAYLLADGTHYGTRFPAMEQSEHARWKALFSEFRTVSGHAERGYYRRQLRSAIGESGHRLPGSVLAVAEREVAAFPALAEPVAAILLVLAQENAPAGEQKVELLARLRVIAEPCYAAAWSHSSFEEQLQLLALAKRGFINPLQPQALTHLVNRNLVDVRLAARIRSRGFANYILETIDNEELTHWISERDASLWSSISTPILLLLALGLAFLFISNPDAVTSLSAVLTASLGAIPLIVSLISNLRNAAAQK